MVLPVKLAEIKNIDNIYPTLKKIRDTSAYIERDYVNRCTYQGSNLAIIVEIWDAHTLSQMFSLFLPPPLLSDPPLSKYTALHLFALGSVQPIPVHCCPDLFPWKTLVGWIS